MHLELHSSTSSHFWCNIWGFHCGEDSSRCLLSLPWGWRHQDPPKHWYPTTALHGVTSQKTSNL